jgi:hypothetical protein
MQYPGVEEFQAIEIKLDAAPGVLFQKIVEIIEQLVSAKAVNPAIEIVADTPDCPCVRINGFRLKTAKFKEFQVALILLIEAGILGHAGVHCNLHSNR